MWPSLPDPDASVPTPTLAPSCPCPLPASACPLSPPWEQNSVPRTLADFPAPLDCQNPAAPLLGRTALLQLGGHPLIRCCLPRDRGVHGPACWDRLSIHTIFLLCSAWDETGQAGTGTLLHAPAAHLPLAGFQELRPHAAFSTHQTTSKWPPCCPDPFQPPPPAPLAFCPWKCKYM